MIESLIEETRNKIDIESIEAQRDLALDYLSIDWLSQFYINYAFSEKKLRNFFRRIRYGY